MSCDVCHSPDSLLMEVVDGRTVLVPCPACNEYKDSELSYVPNPFNDGNFQIMNAGLDAVYKALK